MIHLVWLTLLAVNAGAAAVWWWLMPGGFPSSSTEYWVNQVAPVIVIVVLLTALVARGRFGQTILAPLLLAIPVFWMALAVSARFAFEESSRSSWTMPFVGAAAVAALWMNQLRARVPVMWLVPLVVIPAAIAGWAFPGSQRAPDPTTMPIGAPLGSPPAGVTDQRVIRLTKDVQVRPGDSVVVIRRDKLILNVQPLLTFANRSPDRSLTALAPVELNRPTTRTLVAKVHDAARYSLWYKDEDASVLDVATRPGGAIELDARSRLPQPIFSHGNSFATLTVQGHQKLSVSFSPVPQQRIELAPATAAARFAYLDAGGMFHVMQASQEQRGPFTELAAGPLRRSDPLVLTIYDGDTPVFAVTLQDWAAQTSTQLSPTAGWGIPVNVIELLRGGEPESAPGLISLSLASTSIGRGTQSVGHAAGVYRDRMSISLPSK